MTVQIEKHAWRRALAIGILPFAALGVAGCDNTESVGGGGEEQEQEQGQEQEQEAGGEEEEEDDD